MSLLLAEPVSLNTAAATLLGSQGRHFTRRAGREPRKEESKATLATSTLDAGDLNRSRGGGGVRLRRLVHACACCGLNFPLRNVCVGKICTRPFPYQRLALRSLVVGRHRKAESAGSESLTYSGASTHA